MCTIIIIAKYPCNIKYSRSFMGGGGLCSDVPTTMLLPAGNLGALQTLCLTRNETLVTVLYCGPGQGPLSICHVPVEDLWRVDLLK
jgi:hypothetical protein